MNLAGIGFDAFVVRKVKHYKHLGFLAYLIAGILSILAFKKPMLHIALKKDNITSQRKSLMLLIGLCTYCGGGMQLTKNPDPVDKLFDITHVEQFSFFNILTNINKLFNGQLVNHKKIKTFKSDHIKIQCDNLQNTYIQADGEEIGKGSFSATIINAPIKFIVPNPLKS